MTTSEPAMICLTCGKFRDGHEAYRHPFDDGVTPVPNPFSGKKRDEGKVTRPSMLPATAQVVTSGLHFDPVLRQALIDAGVITPEDLKTAEEKIRAITGMVLQGLPPDLGGQDVPSSG